MELTLQMIILVMKMVTPLIKVEDPLQFQLVFIQRLVKNQLQPARKFLPAEMHPPTQTMVRIPQLSLQKEFSHSREQ